MTQRVALLLFAALLLSISSQSTSQKTRQEAKSNCQLTSEDYAVFTALIAGLGGPEDPEEAWSGKDILITGVTAAPADVRSHWGHWGFRSKSKAAPSHDTVVDFERKARSTCVLNPQFAEGKSYKIITQGELDTAVKDGGWQAFYKKYPEAGGTWTFSRPGYNSGRSEAIVCVSHWCGELCGTGHLYFLAKQNGQWKVQNRLMLWIS